MLAHRGPKLFATGVAMARLHFLVRDPSRPFEMKDGIRFEGLERLDRGVPADTSWAWRCCVVCSVLSECSTSADAASVLTASFDDVARICSTSTWGVPANMIWTSRLGDPCSVLSR